MNEQNNTHAPLKILSLEDSIIDFEIISERLVDAGYHFGILRVDTEKEFSELIRQTTFDIILADYNLPQFDVFEALRLCQESCPSVPFICVSGSIGEIMAIELLKHGATDYVLKDRLERLPFAVKRALDEAIEKNTRKEAEAALKKSEAKLNDAQELAKMGSWILDLETNTFSWSKNMYQMLRFQPFELKPRYEDFLSRVHPEDKQITEKHLQEILITQKPVSYDFRYLLPGDELMWVQNNITPVFRNDELIELHGVNIDITEKKQVEQELIKAKENAEASDRLKTAFMNNISHEIRTPLNGILGFGQMITNPEYSDEAKERYFRMLNESSDRLVNTITNIMDISLLTSGNQKIEKAEIFPENLIEELCETFRATCELKNLALSINNQFIESDFKIPSDGNLIRKILSQLIDNAIKFTSNGTITVGCQKQENELLFFVKDSGIGISEKHKTQIFDNFMQEENDNNRKYDGSGIGLSIAKGFTKLLGGKIWLDSEKGKGSTFYFSIPSM